MDAELRPLETVHGPGVANVTHFGDTLDALIADWRDAHGDLPVWICGAVGGNTSWMTVPYVSVPATAQALRAGARSPAPGVRILPGAATPANLWGRGDVMRGEETQALGAVALLGRESARLCLPGTHPAWVEVVGGAVANLTMSLTGDLLAALRARGVLSGEDASDERSTAFASGVREGADHPHLLSALFGVRAAHALGDMPADDTASRLAGVLVGADCARVCEAWGGPPDAVVGSGGAVTAYHGALGVLGHEVALIDGNDAVLAGLARIVGTPHGLPD